jgi:dipeptidyl aminopeptidase/acylaminoacyl peptidase
MLALDTTGKHEVRELRINICLFSLTIALSIWLDSALAEPLTAQTMWELKRVGDPVLAPDGRLAVVPVTTFDIPANTSSTHLWLVPTKPGKARQLTSGTAQDTAPAFSPDGRFVAFVSKRNRDKESQIYVIAVDGGEARRITDVPTGAFAPKWFPDSKRIAFLSRVWPDVRDWKTMRERKKARDEAKMTARVWEKAPFSLWDHLLDDRATHVFAVDLKGGEPQPLTVGTGLSVGRDDDPDTRSYDISPDGTELAFEANVDATGTQPNYDIFVMPVGGGAARNLTADNPANDLSPSYSPDGKRIAFRRQQRSDLYADRARLMLYERRDGRVRELTENWDRSADQLVWSPEADALFGSIDDAGTRRVYRFDVHGGEPRAITGRGSFMGLAVAGSGPVIVALRSSFSEPPTLVSIIPRTGKATKLSDFNDATLERVQFGRVESVTYPGGNGEPVQMWVVYPPNFTPTRRWPLYLLLHGGPHTGLIDSFHWRWNAQVFAGWGYVTAWPNFHGSSGFGQQWMESILRDWGELPYQDTIAAANWFMAQPWIDRERLAAGGGSFGGYLATVLAGREHPFKTLISHAGVYDLYAQYAGDTGAERPTYGHFWEDRAPFERNSPHLQAGKFRTPMLIMHGQNDFRVPVTHAFGLFNTLQAQRVPSKLVYFPDESHWVLKAQNSLFWYDTMQQWLAKYVPPGPGEPVVPPVPEATAPAHSGGQ